jgi:hypothetical protein
MQEKTITFTELLELTLLFGSLAYIIGLIYQAVIVIKINKSWTWIRLLTLLLVSRTASLFFTLLIGKLIGEVWNIDFNTMVGPFLIPAVVAEIIVSPVFLKIFGYHLKT